MKTAKTFLIFASCLLLAAFAGNVVAGQLSVAPIYPTVAFVGLSCVGAFTKMPVLALTVFGGAKMNLQDLRREAGKLSSYNGNSVSYYTGEGDDLLQFNGSISNFSGELVEHLEKQFVLSVANANAATRTAIIFAGYRKGNATLEPGQLVQGAFNDTGGNAGLTGATASAKSIEELLLFLNVCATRLLAVKIKSDVAAQISQSMTYQRLNPFKDEPTKIIRPDNFQNQDTFQTLQVTFPVNVQIDDQSRVVYPFVGTSNTSLTFYFGTSINVSLSLERKAAKAINNINAVGQDKVVAASVAQKAMLGAG